MSPARHRYRLPIPPRNPRSHASVAPHVNPSLCPLCLCGESAPSPVRSFSITPSIFNVFLSINLQIPLFVSRLFSHRYKPPGCRTPLHLQGTNQCLPNSLNPALSITLLAATIAPPTTCVAA